VVKVPLPPAWGGLRVLPFEFEFWQGRQKPACTIAFAIEPAGDSGGSAAVDCCLVHRAVGALTTAALQGWILQGSLPILRPTSWPNL